MKLDTEFPLLIYDWKREAKQIGTLQDSSSTNTVYRQARSQLWRQHGSFEELARRDNCS